MCVIAVVGMAPCQRFSPGGQPDHVTWPHFSDRTSPALDQAAAGGHDQDLAQRMGMSCCSSAGLEHDTDAEGSCRGSCLEQRVDAYRTDEILGRSLGGGLRTASVDVHLQRPLFNRKRVYFSDFSQGSKFSTAFIS
jgi:hypothetical protein